MAKKNNSATRSAIKRSIIELKRVTDALTRRDIKEWRTAWQMAINVDNPQRSRLIDIYRDCSVDAHLTGCIQQRMGMIKARSFKIVDANNDEHDELLTIFDAPWFKQFIEICIMTPMYGYSLVQLGDFIPSDNEHPCRYSDCTLIPHKHVVPEYHRVTVNPGDDWKTGIDYNEPPFSSYCIGIGQPDDLGIYLKAALQTIPKKNMMAFWDSFGEIFGMPIRVAKTSTRDPKERAQLNNMMKNMGTEQYIITGDETDLSFIESTRGDAYNVYLQRVNVANAELSKLILGQTMTIDNGSSLSQSQTHMDVLRNLIDSECDRIRDIINTQLIPRMIEHGFPLQGMRFDWDYSVDYTPEQQRSFEQMILNHYDVDPAYFEEKYGMKILGLKAPSAPTPLDEPNKKEEETEPILRNFFD